MDADRILLIRTGGTIDAQAYADPRQPPKHVSTRLGDDSLIKAEISTLPGHEKVDYFHWGTRKKEQRFVKDSKLFTPEDLAELADLIKKDDHKYFIVTHGTDAMAKNAEALENALGEDNDKRVVFLGAMVPLSMANTLVYSKPSDATESLRLALENIHAQKPGVYLIAYDTQDYGTPKFFRPSQFSKDYGTSVRELRFINTEGPHRL